MDLQAYKKQLYGLTYGAGIIELQEMNPCSEVLLNNQGHERRPYATGYAICYRIEEGMKEQSNGQNRAVSRCCSTGSAYCKLTVEIGSEIYVPSLGKKCIVTACDETHRLPKTFKDILNSSDIDEETFEDIVNV